MREMADTSMQTYITSTHNHFELSSFLPSSLFLVSSNDINFGIVLTVYFRRNLAQLWFSAALADSKPRLRCEWCDTACPVPLISLLAL
jgi:hypothetical protein